MRTKEQVSIPHQGCDVDEASCGWDETIACETRSEAARWYRTYTAITLIGIAVIVAVYLGIPWLRKPIIRENNFVEMLTALLFLASGLVGVWAMLARRDINGRQAFWLIPAFGFLAFLEEIGYGEPLFHFYVPYLHGEKFDGLHDLIILGYVLVTETTWGFPVLLAVIGGLFGLGVVSGIRLPDLRRTGVLVSNTPAAGFAAICLGLLVAAIILDLEIVRHHLVTLTEELLEASAALALLFAALALRSQGS